MKRKRLLLLSTITTLWLLIAGGTIAVADEGKDESRGQEHRRSEKRDRGDDKEDTYFRQHGSTHLGIPEGHLPSPGECRIWYPGTPPGHQPPPATCGRLRQHVPAGAWLIQRPQDSPAHVDVAVYDAARPGMIISIGVFEAHTGAFMRVRR